MYISDAARAPRKSDDSSSSDEDNSLQRRSISAETSSDRHGDSYSIDLPPCVPLKDRSITSQIGRAISTSGAGFGGVAAMEPHVRGVPEIIDSATESTRMIVQRLTSSKTTERITNEIRARAESFVPPNLVIEYRNSGVGVGGPRPGLFTRAFAAEKYAAKYDMPVAHVNRKEGSSIPGEELRLPNHKIQFIATNLHNGKQVSLITRDIDGHSIPVVVGLDDNHDVKAVVLNSLERDSENMVQVRAALVPIANTMEARLSVTSSLDIVRQSDGTSCYTDAIVLLKDIHLNEPKFAINYEDGESIPSSALRSTQRPVFLQSNDYEPSAIYNPRKGKSVGEHREAHTIDTDVQSGRNRFLHAKSIQLADAAVRWLEKFPDPECAKQTAASLVTKHFPSGEPAWALAHAVPEVPDFPVRRTYFN